MVVEDEVEARDNVRVNETWKGFFCFSGNSILPCSVGV